MACHHDTDGRERRTEITGEVDCPRCGKPVPLVAETEEWHEGADGEWTHANFGPSMGTCCDLLIVDSWDACEVYDLGEK